MSGAIFRDCDTARASPDRGSSFVDGLRGAPGSADAPGPVIVDDVDVSEYVAAELDRRHPRAGSVSRGDRTVDRAPAPSWSTSNSASSVRPRGGSGTDAGARRSRPAGRTDSLHDGRVAADAGRSVRRDAAAIRLRPRPRPDRERGGVGAQRRGVARRADRHPFHRLGRATVRRRPSRRRRECPPPGSPRSTPTAPGTAPAPRRSASSLRPAVDRWRGSSGAARHGPRRSSALSSCLRTPSREPRGDGSARRPRVPGSAAGRRGVLAARRHRRAST